MFSVLVHRAIRTAFVARSTYSLSRVLSASRFDAYVTAFLQSSVGSAFITCFLFT